MKNVLFLAAVLLVGAGVYLTITNSADPYDQAEHHDHDEHYNELLTPKEPVRADGAFTITTSFYPLAFALERITGDLATVINIGSGQDPHDFRPSTQDSIALQQSDLVVLQGAEFEPWGDDVKAQLEAESVPVLVATAGLDLRELGEDSHGHDEEDHHEDEDHHDETEHEEDHDHSHGDYDPHTWLDPILFSETVATLAAALSTLDPENTETYTTNAQALQTELAALDVEYKTALANCTLDETITSHEAFGYLGERYDFTIHTIAGISTQDLPSTQTLAELRAEAAEGVGAILLEENSVTAYGETLARETGLATLSINPASYSIAADADYFSLMRANLEVLTEALQCNE